MPTLRHHLKGAVMCLGLGLLTSMLVAWVLAGTASIPMYPRDTVRVFATGDRAYHAAEVHQRGITDVWWSLMDEEPGTAIERAADAATQARISVPGRPDPKVMQSPPRWGSLSNPAPDLPRIGSDTAFGWPAPALWYQVTGRLSRGAAGNLQVDHDELHGGILIKGELSSRGRAFRAIPFRPIWLGITLDTLAYAAPLWLLFFGRPLLREHRRRRNGLCPLCGYDLRASPGPCPECGPPPR